MRTALYEQPLQIGGVTPVVPDGPVTAILPQQSPVRWRSQFFTETRKSGGKRQRATRYERFTTRMVLVSSVIMLGVTASLHVFNYGLETKTSSTSGTHGEFYKAEE